MFQDESVFLTLLAGMGLTVLGLVVTVMVLARSLYAKKKADTAAAKFVSKSAPDTAASSTADKAEVPSTPSLSTGAATDHQEPDDVTQVTIFSPSAQLPRLSAEHDDDDDANDDSDEHESLEESIAKLMYDSEALIDIDEPTGPNDLILVSAIGQTDQGITRRRNEDAYLIDTRLQLVAVADGMGGYGGGDIASRLAVQELWTAMGSPTEGFGYEDRPRRGRELIAAVERANSAVYREAQTTHDLHGMGTTMVAARFSPQKQRMYVAHVGDSRCYRFRRGELRMLTKDHTLESRGVVGPLAKNICRAVGIAKKVKVDLIVDKPLPDDLFLFCSDGLPKMVTDEHIRRILSNDINALSLDRAVAQLILAANAGGGRDNITVVLVRIQEITKTMRTAALVRSQARVEFGPS